MMLINCFKAMLVMIVADFNILIIESSDIPSETLQALGTINNDFAFNLLRELKAEDETKNIFISPLIISMAFGMLYYGSAGNTDEELQKAIGYKKAGLTKESVNFAYNHFLLDELEKSAKFTLNAANAIFVDNSLDLSAAFKNEIQEKYFAKVEDVDFGKNTPNIVKDVNSWVKTQTKGKISELLKTLDPQTVFILLSAVYFKSLWKDPFNPENTHMEHFLNNGLKSEAKNVPMMHKRGRFRISSNPECKALELPYVEDDIVMLIMKPNHGLKSLEDKLTHLMFVEILKNMRNATREISIPKFEMDFSVNLVSYLKTLGIKTIFEDADFSEMFVHGTAPIGEFIHKAKIEVNEEGTEAAAVGMIATKKSLETSFDIDGPFVFAILDKRINFVLFLGRVSNLYQSE